MEEYKKNEWYEGLGKYVGVITVYPYNKTYYMKVRKFIGKPPTDGRKCAEIKEIEIERFDR